MEYILYDGTYIGFLNLLSYLSSLKPEVLEAKKIINLRLYREGERLFFSKKIESNQEVAKSFLRDILLQFGKEIQEKLFLYYLCDTKGLEKTLAKVLKRGSLAFPNNLTDEDLIELYHAEREFYRERHRYYGFLRFIQLPRGPLVAVFEPKFNVLPKLYPHFVNRFPNEDFIIFDKKRNLLFSYLKRKKGLYWVDGLEIHLDPKADPYIQLFKEYFNAISVPERVSYERQRSRLPLRYRAFMPEFW